MTAPAHTTRRRSWLFVPGADEFAHERAARSGADVLIQELEDFTPPPLRERARARAPALYARWRAGGAVVAVRVNPLSTCGRDDLAAVNRAFTPPPAEIARARRIVAAFEKGRRAPPGASARASTARSSRFRSTPPRNGCSIRLTVSLIPREARNLLSAIC